MLISDISVKRPVFATVLNLLVIAFGIISFLKTPLREYPDTDPPVISISTSYRGAAANVVETRITEPIEDRLAGVEGVKSISSQSSDGRSRVTVEFDIERDIDDAANDIRDRVSGIVGNLPDEADPPEVRKADSDDEVILWLNLQGEGMGIIDITDYARRYIEDRFSSLDGVARVQIGGARDIAMRVWVDRNKLAARNLTVEDIQNALRSENVELPAGTIESVNRDFTVRVQRSYNTAEDFAGLVLAKGDDGYMVRLSDVARVEVAAAEERGTLRGNGVPMVGIGIVKQSKANTIDVARLARQEMAFVNQTLPTGMRMDLTYDTSVFIESAVHEVYFTLAVTTLLVMAVMYFFLGSLRAMVIPSLAVPVSLIGAFIFIYALGFTVNLLTLLALVLAIGLVVDDAIVVIENVHRRMEQGEPPLLAAFRGVRQVGFAVVATTIVLVAVFIPITFLEGDIGRLFTEFSVTMAAAISLSLFVALTLSPMLSSKILKAHGEKSAFNRKVDAYFEKTRAGYLRVLAKLVDRPLIAIALLTVAMTVAYFSFRDVPSEFAPKEDRGAFFMNIRGPEGASYAYILEHLDEIEKRLLPFVKTGEFQRILMLAPGSFGVASSFNDARGIVALNAWGERKPISHYTDEVRRLTSDLTGVQISAIARQGLGGGSQKPVQFVLGGPTYAELAQWRDILLDKARENKGLTELDHDYFETKPQIGITIDKTRAADLGVSVSSVSQTLESMLGSRRVTTFIDRGKEYDVILESEKNLKSSPMDISNIYVRSQRTGARIPLSSLVEIREFADAASLNRYNRVRSITLSAALNGDYALGEALTYLEGLVRTELPGGAAIDYKGESLKFKESREGVLLVFCLALLVVYLVLAGQFESFVHPFIIMLTVPMAVSGAAIALWVTGQTLNIYSEIGLILLAGLATKNGILIVEFINQLRDEGVEFRAAIIEASAKRFRPIIMTSITTVVGAVPLVMAGGAGAESRYVIGVVIIGGLIFSTALTIFIVPAMYRILARNTLPPDTTSRNLEKLLLEHEHKV